MLKRNLFILLFSAFLFQCAEEDMDLVNAPPQSESIRVRFINMMDDKEPRTLSLDGKVQTGEIAYTGCSVSIKPPADSSVAIIFKNGVEEFRGTRKIRFSKNNFYTVFAHESFEIDTSDKNDLKPLKQMSVSSTLANLLKRDGFAHLRMYNAVRDSNRSYSLRLGCPNGELIGTSPYMRTTSAKEVYSESVAVSLLRTDDGQTEFLGLFILNLEEYRQYMFVIMPKDDGSEEAFLLDEMNENADLQPLTAETDALTTEIKIVNLSSSEQSVFKYPDSTLVDGLVLSIPTNEISEFKKVQACSGNVKDTLLTYAGADTNSMVISSLGISEKYLLFSMDSLNEVGSSLVLAEPYRADSKGYALVRVLNAAFEKPNLTISIAANSYSDTQDSLGYKSGDLIVSNSIAGEISSPIWVVPGQNLPITVFTAGESAQLEYTALADLEADRKYIMIVDWDDVNNEYKLYLIDEMSATGQLEQLQEGVFTQYVNLLPGHKTINVSIEPILNNITMYYGASVATVLSPGQHNFKIHGKDTAMNLNVDERMLFVFAGDSSAVDFLVYKNEPLDTELKAYNRRFLNASKDINLISIKENDSTENTIFFLEALDYKELSDLERKDLERNLSFFFYDYRNPGVPISRVYDLPFPFGKNYTVIFGGDTLGTGLSVVVQQEY